MLALKLGLYIKYSLHSIRRRRLGPGKILPHIQLFVITGNSSHYPPCRFDGNVWAAIVCCSARIANLGPHVPAARLVAYRRK